MNTENKSSNTTRIILVEDHHVLRNGLKMLIDSQKDMTVVGEAGDGEAALTLLSNEIVADVLISDLNMPEMDGFTLFEHISALKLNIYMIAFSMLNGEKHVEKAFQTGCSGYLTKSVESEELLFGIRQVALNKKYICSEIVDSVVSNLYTEKSIDHSKNLPTFSERELEILELIGNGLTNVEIGEKIFLSRRTIEGHRQSLLDKTASKNSAALVKYAVINGILR